MGIYGELINLFMKKIIFLIIIVFLSFFIINNVFADFVIDNGLNFLKSKQDAAGRITSGFSAPSQWSAIAFAANGIDISAIKNPTTSLKDFLVSNIPSEPSSATDWETRILAIVATDGDPTSYGGINYINHLESFYNNNQIGDICSLNDDIFGLLAEVAAGSTSNTQIKQNILDFLISKQDPSDGGFGYSAPGCAWYSTSADMTGAAIQALVAAKNNGLTNSNLDNAIDHAKNYLLTNQDIDGGYGYYGSSDSDSTGWVLMAFNVLSMTDSTTSAKTKDWLISQQSKEDGGFLAFDYGLNKSVSNSTTTAQAIIGLSGKSWILKIFDPLTITPTPTGLENPTPTITPTMTPTNTPIPTAVITPTPTSVPTMAPQLTLIPTTIPVPTITITILKGSEDPTPTETKKTTGQVIGVKTNKVKTTSQPINKNVSLSTIIFLGLGILSLIIHKGIM